MKSAIVITSLFLSIPHSSSHNPLRSYTKVSNMGIEDKAALHRALFADGPETGSSMSFSMPSPRPSKTKYPVNSLSPTDLDASSLSPTSFYSFPEDTMAPSTGFETSDVPSSLSPTGTLLPMDEATFAAASTTNDKNLDVTATIGENNQFESHQTTGISAGSTAGIVVVAASAAFALSIGFYLYRKRRALLARPPRLASMASM